MTPPEVSIAEGGILDLDSVMRVMDDSFDPAFGEAWTAPQVVGFALGRFVVNEAEGQLLAIKRDAQGRGIGQSLLDRFISIAASRGAERLHLEVREGNHAVKLYSRAGFIEVGRRGGYYSGRDGQVYDALTLARSAAP